MDPLAKYSLLTLLGFYIPKLLTALVCGGLVGYERERKNKVAGFKTNILICSGATLFTATSFLLADGTNLDPLRVVSYVISGIGFLGAGAIFKAKEKVMGLTTASFIWCISAIGIIIGSGGYAISIILTLGMLAVMSVLGYIEDRFIHKDDA